LKGGPLRRKPGEVSSELLLREVPGDRLAVAIDPGKVSHRVWLTTGERGLIGEPVSLPVFRDGVEELERLIAGSGVSQRAAGDRDRSHRRAASRMGGRLSGVGRARWQRSRSRESQTHDGVEVQPSELRCVLSAMAGVSNAA